MIIYWNRETGEVSMRDSDDFRRFNLLCSGARPETTPAGVPFDIRFENPDHAWVPVLSIAAIYGNPDESWLSAMDEMIEKAAKAGWVSEDNRDVRAHAVWEVDDAY